VFSLNTESGQSFIKEITKLQYTWAEVIYQKCNLDIELLSEFINKSEYLLRDGALINTSRKDRINMLQDIVKLLEVHQPKFRDDLINLKSRYDKFYEVLTRGNDFDLLQWAKDEKISPILIGQLIEWILRPERMALGKIIQPLFQKNSNWEKQSCPICGEQADLAILLKENGERHLGCSCCQIKWRYPRLKCISCENTNPETLKYYFVEEAPEQQIHYCESCKSYLKTVDYRFINEKFEDLLLLNYMTAHLDVLAEKNGLRTRNFN